jgi:hypothetical protein
MSNKRQRLDHIDVNILPKEVWCIIFSYLDEKSIRSSSATCKLWLELIRNDLKISSYIFLVNDGLKEFQAKLEKSEWMWERWPSVKTLEFGGPPSMYELNSRQEAEKAMNIMKSINFKQCETLEKVVFSVKFDLVYFWEKYHSLATVEKLTFNPQVETKSFEIEQIEHVSRLVLSFKINRLESNKDIICQGLQLIGEKAKCLNTLSIYMLGVPNDNDDMAGDLDFLKNGFCSMFKGLNDSLETIIFCDKNDNYKLDFDILKCLSEQNCKNLTRIVVMTNYNISICPKVGCFQNLKVLSVLKLCYIDGFDQNYNTITHLCVEKADMAKLKEFDLRTMVQNFKKLKKCYFNVTLKLTTQGLKRWQMEGQHILDETFQESTEVKFVFKAKRYHRSLELEKLPYQKSTLVLGSDHATLQ